MVTLSDPGMDAVPEARVVGGAQEGGRGRPGIRGRGPEDRREVIHEASVWCLEQLGVPEGATIEGPPASASAPEEGLMEHRFRALIRHLAASFPWLSRSDGVTDYRRQEAARP